MSKRTQSELRNDLNFANQKRVTPGVTGETLVTTELGSVLNWMGTTAIESNGEDYFGDVGAWEARIAYEIGENVSISLEGINLFNAPKEQYFFTTDNLGEVNVYGPRYFLGIRGKF